ncbi:LysR family transcriptional regulator [Arenicella xantha]|uniref:LysR family transcriptional regulator n=1 Tax=Arenicella xantha TaxID=644221 RepID=A0A395JQU4_9GAMM|nr:LysR family transcriptional regulator [Arenicella xantha]RBP52692.1 LysR family transcriptional regulator [Arenicella xantha]
MLISRIEMFIEVVRHESFAGAARKLGVSGPAVTKQVQALEEALGVKLLYRTTRKVTLTEEGAIYFERVEKAIDDLAEAEQTIQELKACPTGRLKVNAPMSFGSQYLAGPIAEFAQRYPDVALEVDFDDRWVDVIGEGFDVVIRIGTLKDSSLVARKLGDCPLVMCIAPDCVAKYGPIDRIEQLAEYPAVVYTKHGQTEDWRYIAPSGEHGSVKLRRAFAGNSAPMQVAACKQGLGIAVLPIFAVWEDLQSGALQQVLPDYQSYPVRGIYAVFPQNRHLSTRVRLFVDWMSEVNQRFPWLP